MKNVGSMSYKAYAPGSINLLGEHAVLHGYPAVACAIDKRLFVELIPNETQEVFLTTDRFGDHSCHINNIKVVAPFKLALTALAHYQKELPSGFTLRIKSEFSPELGLGSSAALTVAVVSLLHRWLGKSSAPMDIFQGSLSIVRAVQGFGSGTDLITSLLGGVVVLHPEPLHIEKLKPIPYLCLVYAGYKTPTTEVVRIVREAQQKDPKKYDSLFEEIGHCAEEGSVFIKQEDWEALGKVFSKQQGLMEKLGVCDSTLKKIVKVLEKKPEMLGAKISGSGLGDCVVGLTASPQKCLSIPHALEKEGIETIPIQIDLQGLRYERV